MEDGDDTGYRMRQMLRAAYPLGLGQQWNAVVWDELFVNTNDTDWGARSGIDQNRAFVGVSMSSTKELGWKLAISTNTCAPRATIV